MGWGRAALFFREGPPPTYTDIPQRGVYLWIILPRANTGQFPAYENRRGPRGFAPRLKRGGFLPPSARNLIIAGEALTVEVLRSAFESEGYPDIESTTDRFL